MIIKIIDIITRKEKPKWGTPGRTYEINQVSKKKTIKLGACREDYACSGKHS